MTRWKALLAKCCALILALCLATPDSNAQTLPERPITELKLTATGANAYKLTPGRYRLTAQLQLDQLLKSLPANSTVDASGVVILGSKSYKARAIGANEPIPPGLPRTVTSAGKTYDVLVIPVDADLAKVLAVGDTDFGCSATSKLSIYESLQGHVDDWRRMDCTRYPAKGFWTSPTATSTTLGTDAKGAKIYQALIDCPPILSGCTAGYAGTLSFAGYPTYDWAHQTGEATISGGKLALSYNGGYAPATSNTAIVLRGFATTIKPGEFIADPANGRIFLVPSTPGTGAAMPSFEIPLVLSNTGDVPALVSIYGQGPNQANQLANNITIDGLELSFGTDNGLHIRGARYLNLRNFRIIHLGGTGVYGNRVAINNDPAKYGYWPYNYYVAITNSLFHDLGAGGVSILGGDRSTLSPSGNVLRQNVFSATNVMTRTYAPAVQLNGSIAVTVSDSLIFNLPHQAIALSGNNHEIARNRFSCTNYETADTGVIYNAQNLTWRGSIIGGNIFDDNRVAVSRRLHWNTAPVNGVYFDNPVSAHHVLGNIALNGDRFARLNGGSYHSVMANVVVNPQRADLSKLGARKTGAAIDLSDSDCTWPAWPASYLDGYNSAAALAAWKLAYPEMAQPLKLTTPKCQGRPNTLDDTYPHNNTITQNLLLATASTTDYLGKPGSATNAYAMFDDTTPLLPNTARNAPPQASNNAFARLPWTGTTPNILPAIKAAVQSYMTQFPTTGVSSATKTGQMLDKARTYLTGAADAYAANAKVWQRILGPRVNLERLPCDRVGY